MNRVFIGFMLMVAAACSEAGTSGKEWLTGSEDDRFTTVSRHLRGLDMTMFEIGYRYNELYWAGRDHNWEYASYQIGKIDYTLKLGLERRPARAPAAKMIEQPIAALKRAIEERDPAGFTARFADLTRTCNTCHTAEKVEFMHVQPPTVRISPIHGAR
ncbi:MAG: cytochrome c [Leptonema illini]|jgi:hypothetical protein|uniref:Cytochrome c n=1 Tax=Leptonema illini TaxID=183 RepID=A0A833H0N8_9LEPT|nr:MAG: cytochrome c [Leptonema illini]